MLQRIFSTGCEIQRNWLKISFAVFKVQNFSFLSNLEAVLSPIIKITKMLELIGSFTTLPQTTVLAITGIKKAIVCIF